MTGGDEGEAARPARSPRRSSLPVGPLETPQPDLHVLVTGICGRLGRLLARQLHRVARVSGIDRRPFPERPKDVAHHALDLRRSGTRDLLRSERFDAVVHLGALHDPRASESTRHDWNVLAFGKLLEYVAQYDVPKLVLLSSADVYGPQPGNPQFLREDAPLQGSRSVGAMRDLVEMDMLAQSFFWKHPATETVILRPCHILGGVRNAASNYLRLERPLTVLGYDPMVQVIHERDVVTALIKSLRGSDPDAALYWMFRLLEAGDDPRFVLRRLVIFASEDIGNADPRALQVAVAADAAYQRLGLPEGFHALGQCCTYLACAPKSNASYVAWKAAQQDAREAGSLPVPLHLRNAPTKLMKAMGAGEGYRYPHDEGGYAPGVVYLPERLEGRRYYVPTENGLEARIGARLARLRDEVDGDASSD